MKGEGGGVRGEKGEGDGGSYSTFFEKSTINYRRPGF